MRSYFSCSHCLLYVRMYMQNDFNVCTFLLHTPSPPPSLFEAPAQSTPDPSDSGTSGTMQSSRLSDSTGKLLVHTT